MPVRTPTPAELEDLLRRAIDLRAPATLPAIGVAHDELGKPVFALTEALGALLAEKGLVAHLSISDEAEYAVAYVILERT